jgi:hypothetical protein
MVVVDPNPDRSERPCALDNQVKIIPDPVDIASRNDQARLIGSQVERTFGTPRGGSEHNLKPKTPGPPAFGLNDHKVKALITGNSSGN